MLIISVVMTSVSQSNSYYNYKPYSINSRQRLKTYTNR